MAAIQMVSGPRVADNLAAAGQLIADAAGQGAQLVALPEYFPIIGADDDRVRAREDFGAGPIQEWLAATARRHGVWIFAGTIPLTASVADRMRNSTLVFDPAGRCVERYDKVHLFGFTKGEESYDEAAFIEPGTELAAVDTPFGRVALSICYDLRFPEQFRALMERGMEILALPAAFTAATGLAHWETLLRARAIENQCYVIASAQGGRHANGRETHGDSLIIDPWGAILDRLPHGPGVVLAEFDRERLENVRRQFPVLEHRVHCET
jgi:nitrilase